MNLRAVPVERSYYYKPVSSRGLENNDQWERWNTTAGWSDDFVQMSRPGDCVGRVILINEIAVGLEALEKL